MSVVVNYPVEVKQYSVTVKKEIVEIVLEGDDGSTQAFSSAGANTRRVGRITFGDPSPIGDKDFITRGGFLQMDRSLEMFSGVLDMLRNEKPIYLRGDGILSTLLEPVGEDEDLPT